MALYRQSIIVFGAVIPLIVTIAIIAVGSVAKSKMTVSFKTKVDAYKAHELSSNQTRDIEAKIMGQRIHLDRWTQQLSQETPSTVSSYLREISEKLPSKEIQQTSFERVTGGGGFSNVSAQKSAQVRLAYRGTYRTLERAFLNLETLMPQLILQEIKIDPAPNSSSLINMQISYSAWENE